MNKLLARLLRQTWYFKLVFVVTTLLLLVIGGYMLNGIVGDLQGVRHNETDAGWVSVFYVPGLIGLAAGYAIILVLCSRRSLVGKLSSVVVLLGLLLLGVQVLAEMTA